MKKNNYQKVKGFTLIEILLVLVIIGILAGAVYSMIGNSDNANTKSALSTAKSIMPYAQECMFKGNNINTASEGTLLCSGSETRWPGIGPSDCGYGTTTPATWTWTIVCDFNPDVTITCSAETGVCDPVTAANP